MPMSRRSRLPRKILPLSLSRPRYGRSHVPQTAFLITSKLLSKAFIFVCLYISYLNTLLYITALDNNHLHLDRFLSHILSSWSFSHERSVISFGIILT